MRTKQHSTGQHHFAESASHGEAQVVVDASGGIPNADETATVFYVEPAPGSRVAIPRIPAELDRPLLLPSGRRLGWFSDRVADLIESRTPAWWWALFVPSALCTLMLLGMLAYETLTGVGVWGNNRPAMWGWDIVNFVWWIGIGHAGTLISAILFLLRQRWRTAVNRLAEAMTILAVLCAVIYPSLHVGRAWYNWWLFPLPNANSVWPNFASPLIWDVFAVFTYFTVSVLFWYLGLIPDLAILRDRAQTRPRQFLYGLFALGWTGSNRHWSNYEKSYLLLAGLSTALVVSVHSIVALDFSVSQLPGWHLTLLPPYFVAGAIFSGLGMLLTVVIPVRALCRLEDIITLRHVELMCKVTLATGLIVAYAYATEFFIAWYSGSAHERFQYLNRVLGPYVWAWIPVLVCNVLLPQLFWFRQARRNLLLVFVLSILINIGMWSERFMIIVVGLHRDFIPTNWGSFQPTPIDVCTYLGTFGLFATGLLLFLRFLPVIAVSEIKGLSVQADPSLSRYSWSGSPRTQSDHAGPDR